jgi:transposase InsO family protein
MIAGVGDPSAIVEDRTRDTRKFRMLCVADEFTREALAIKVARRFDSNHVVEVLADLCVVRGVPEHIRSDQGSEFIAKAVKDWIAAVGAKTAYIEKSSPGRTAMWRASTASSGTSCSTSRSSTHCGRPRS